MTRQFGETRVYVLPPWELSLQTGWNAVDGEPSEEKAADEDAPSMTSLQNGLTQEVELGLPYRFQIDYEARGDNQGSEWRFASQSIELRWALADWDRIVLNPTLFAEWKFRNAEADSYELKLLLGDDFGRRFHWGGNLFFEQQVGDEREQEIAASQALSYTIIDQVLSVDAEMKFSAESHLDEDHDRQYGYIFEIGPGLQWRPTQNLFIDVVPLFGATHSPTVDSFVFVGFTFDGERATEAGGLELLPSMRAQ